MVINTIPGIKRLKLANNQSHESLHHNNHELLVRDFSYRLMTLELSYLSSGHTGTVYGCVISFFMVAIRWVAEICRGHTAYGRVWARLHHWMCPAEGGLGMGVRNCLENA